MTSCCRVYKVLSFQHQITPDEDTRTGVSKRWVVDAILCGDCIHQNKTSVAVKYVKSMYVDMNKKVLKANLHSLENVNF